MSLLGGCLAAHTGVAQAGGCPACVARGMLGTMHPCPVAVGKGEVCSGDQCKGVVGARPAPARCGGVW